MRPTDRKGGESGQGRAAVLARRSGKAEAVSDGQERRHDARRVSSRPPRQARRLERDPDGQEIVGKTVPAILLLGFPEPAKGHPRPQPEGQVPASLNLFGRHLEAK